MAIPTTHDQMYALSFDSTFRNRVMVAVVRRAWTVQRGTDAGTPTAAQDKQHALALAVLAPDGAARYVPAFALAAASLGTVDGSDDTALLGAVNSVFNDIAGCRSNDGAKIP